jgi:hypothetical protein
MRAPPSKMARRSLRRGDENSSGRIFIWESIPKNMSNVPQAATQAAFIYAGPAVTHLSAPLFPGAGLFRCGRHGRHGMIGVGFDRDTSRGYQQCDLAPPLPYRRGFLFATRHHSRTRAAGRERLKRASPPE